YQRVDRRGFRRWTLCVRGLAMAPHGCSRVGRPFIHGFIPAPVPATGALRSSHYQRSRRRSMIMTQATTVDNAIPRADTVQQAARLGAEIKNIKLSRVLSDDTISAINKLLLEHKVIFFRNQNHLDDSEQERFAIRLGKLVPHPTVGAIKGTSSILELDSGRGGGRADQWHTDVTFVDAYPKISVLRGVVIPPFGGDTVWSNTAAAYLDLPAPLRRLADELWAVHSNAYDYAVKARASEADRKHFDEVFTGTIYETEHTVVR